MAADRHAAGGGRAVDIHIPLQQERGPATLTIPRKPSNPQGTGPARQCAPVLRQGAAISRGITEKLKISPVSISAAGFCAKKPWDPERIPVALCLTSCLWLRNIRYFLCFQMHLKPSGQAARFSLPFFFTAQCGRRGSVSPLQRPALHAVLMQNP